MKYFAVTIVALLSLSAIGSVVLASGDTNFRIQIQPGPECFDGQDNDSDGKVDYPADPGCASVVDNTEQDGSSEDGDGFQIDPSTNVLFIGRASPNSTIELLKDGEFESSIAIGQTGRFSLGVNNLTPGSYMFALSTHSVAGERSKLLAVPITVTLGSQTQVSNVFLAPIIRLSKPVYTQGEPVVVSGETAPGSSITVHVLATGDHTLIGTANTQGAYIASFPSLPAGTASAWAEANLSGEISDTSSSIPFTITTIQSGGGSNGGSSGGAAFSSPQNTNTQPKATETPTEKSIAADITGDGKVNLIDFSIAAYWYKRPIPAGEHVPADLNNDGVVDLQDFSILAFYWTG